MLNGGENKRCVSDKIITLTQNLKLKFEPFAALKLAITKSGEKGQTEGFAISELDTYNFLKHVYETFQTFIESNVNGQIAQNIMIAVVGQLEFFEHPFNTVVNTINGENLYILMEGVLMVAKIY